MWKYPCCRTMEAVCGCGKKKSPWERGEEIGLPGPTYLLSSTQTLQRKRERQQVQCVPFIETQELVCVCVCKLLCLYVCAYSGKLLINWHGSEVRGGRHLTIDNSSVRLYVLPRHLIIFSFLHTKNKFGYFVIVPPQWGLWVLKISLLGAFKS